jgi:hypothetical protein
MINAEPSFDRLVPQPLKTLGATQGEREFIKQAQRVGALNVRGTGAYDSVAAPRIRVVALLCTRSFRD